MKPLSRAIELLGGPVAFTSKLNERLAKPVSYQAVKKWEAKGRLPRTDWTGETAYAAAIELITEGKVTRAELLALEPATASPSPDIMIPQLRQNGVKHSC
jgi:hypothetical protein